jgi:hypothetical protein
MVTATECKSKHKNINWSITSIILVLTIISGFVLAASKDGSDAKQNVNDLEGDVTDKIHKINTKFDAHASTQEERDVWFKESLVRIEKTLNSLHPREGE